MLQQQVYDAPSHPIRKQSARSRTSKSKENSVSIPPEPQAIAEDGVGSTSLGLAPTAKGIDMQRRQDDAAFHAKMLAGRRNIA